MAAALYPFALKGTLAAKVGSILVHVEEGLSPDGHQFDWSATQALLGDAEVVEWLRELQKMALVPVKREMAPLRECSAGCQYALDVDMPAYRCVGGCRYATLAGKGKK